MQADAFFWCGVVADAGSPAARRSGQTVDPGSARRGVSVSASAPPLAQGRDASRGLDAPGLLPVKSRARWRRMIRQPAVDSGDVGSPRLSDVIRAVNPYR